MDMLFEYTNHPITVFVLGSIVIIIAHALMFALYFRARYKAKGKLHKHGMYLGAFIGANVGLVFVAVHLAYAVIKDTM